MLKNHSSNGSTDRHSPQQIREEVRKVLAAHGFADERMNEVVAQLNVLVDAPPSDS